MKPNLYLEIMAIKMLTFPKVYQMYCLFFLFFILGGVSCKVRLHSNG